MSEIIQSDNLVVLNVRVYKHQMDALHDLAKKNNVPIAEVLRDILSQTATSYKSSSTLSSEILTDVRATLENVNHRLSSPTDTLERLDNLEQVTSMTSQDIIGTLTKVLDVVTLIAKTQQFGSDDEDGVTEKVDGVMFIPLAKADKKGTFYCQGIGCGKETPNKKKHRILIGADELVVGDCCYFNDRWKDLVGRVL